MTADDIVDLARPLCGIVPPMLTPLRDRDTLDDPGLGRLVEHILAGGVSGLFILGTTGEGPSLSYRLRREMIERTCRLVGGRVPVLVSITDTAFVESVAVAKAAADTGADALVLAPPYYLPEGQPELREYVSHLLPQLPLPLFLYNMPPLTKVPLELDTVRWAIDQPGIVGMKDSSGDMGYFNRVLRVVRERPDWSLLIGPEQLLAQATFLGGQGGEPGGGNLFPRLYVTLFEAARHGEIERARVLQGLAQEVADQVYTVGRHPSAIIKGLQCAVACLGLCDDFMAEPFHRFRDPEREQVRQAVAELAPRIQQAVETPPAKPAGQQG
jgi:dihydrodipicolinate synthase/N-acetylneuraminate lyase